MIIKNFFWFGKDWDSSSTLLWRKNRDDDFDKEDLSYLDEVREPLYHPRYSRYVDYNGRKYPAKQFAEMLGVSITPIYNKLKKWMTGEEIIYSLNKKLYK